MTVCVSAQSVQKSYPTPTGELAVLQDVSLTLSAGESAAIMGPSGSGKSTLLNILGTLDAPTAGRVMIDDCNPYELTERELAQFRNRRIGFVFQDQHLLGHCTAEQNVLLPTLAGPGNPDAGGRARELLNRVGLANRMDHLPSELSGGERQRVAIARALINRPTLVLADEPTGNLDRETANNIASLLCEIQAEQNIALLVVTHNPELADRFSRRFEVADGTLVAR